MEIFFFIKFMVGSIFYLKKINKFRNEVYMLFVLYVDRVFISVC